MADDEHGGLRASIGDLAAQVREQFAKVDERFAKVDERFTKIDDRFTKIDDRFTKIDDRFTQLEATLRAEIRTSAAETRRHFDVVAESLKPSIRIVAEGYAHHTEVLDALLTSSPSASPTPPASASRWGRASSSQVAR